MGAPDEHVLRYTYHVCERGRPVFKEIKQATAFSSDDSGRQSSKKTQSSSRRANNKAKCTRVVGSCSYLALAASTFSLAKFVYLEFGETQVLHPL